MKKILLTKYLDSQDGSVPAAENLKSARMMFPGDREPKCFFKIMLPPILEHKRLRIPIKFVKEFSNDISSPATLLLPGDKRWPVKLLSEGGELWFADGLDKFFDFYSVSFGFFLLFEYRGNSEFRVRIFNLTACEISYSSFEQADRSESESESESDLLVREKKEVESTSNHADDSYNPEEEFNYNYGSGSDNDVVVVQRRRSRPVNFALSSDDEDEPISMRKKARLKKQDDENSSSSAQRPKNPSFRVKMKSYNIESDPLLNIPAGIGRKYPSGMSGLVKLEAPDGRSWTVQGNFLALRLTSLGGGWSDFVQEMKLKVGDRCAFEVIINDEEFCLKFSRARNKHSTRGTV